MNQAKIIQRHYGLDRKVTPEEVAAEITNLRRRGLGNLDDPQERLAAALDIFRSTSS